ncbi:MAG: hypothetical protein GX895_10005 [Clostridiales bacterium]|uniref:hypothetical protein n=1 Tax=Clostridium sp. DMHC 10 TaxID=747377 RepID=UPI00069D0DD3|nr:hypothetical protein [Clostridium sp. DMHC 10]KOF56372.1 hypothetical protein AGR56_06040 [Clostridium sp. DMHC 10]NLZ49095.1 hypothetical protein [Clostridiales bacterium]
MNKNKGINRDNYKYISSLIAQLLELDIDTEEKITGYIENYGVDNFLKDYDKMELSYEIYEKLESLGMIIENMGGAV